MPAADEPITLINVFEVPADQVDTFVDAWRERARIMSEAPGFRHSRLHRALPAPARFAFVNVAQWDSVEAWQAAVSNPRFQAAIGSLPPAVRGGSNPAAYEVVVEYP